MPQLALVLLTLTLTLGARLEIGGEGGGPQLAFYDNSNSLLAQVEHSAADAALVIKNGTGGAGRLKASDVLIDSGNSGDPVLSLSSLLARIAALEAAQPQQVAVPAGAVFYLATDRVPAGYLACDGSFVARADYPALYAAISDRYHCSSTNNYTHFCLPDLRGEFVRGWDGGSGRDPDAANRMRPDGSIADAVGTSQSWAMEPLSGTFYVENGVTQMSHMSGVFSYDTSGTSTSGFLGGNYQPATKYKTKFQSSDQVQTSAETRPRNVALLAVISVGATASPVPSPPPPSPPPPSPSPPPPSPSPPPVSCPCPAPTCLTLLCTTPPPSPSCCSG